MDLDEPGSKMDPSKAALRSYRSSKAAYSMYSMMPRRRLQMRFSNPMHTTAVAADLNHQELLLPQLGT
jgi:hypothetical protein